MEAIGQWMGINESKSTYIKDTILVLAGIGQSSEKSHPWRIDLADNLNELVISNSKDHVSQCSDE